MAAHRKRTPTPEAVAKGEAWAKQAPLEKMADFTRRILAVPKSEAVKPKRRKRKDH